MRTISQNRTSIRVYRRLIRGSEDPDFAHLAVFRCFVDIEKSKVAALYVEDGVVCVRHPVHEREKKVMCRMKQWGQGHGTVPG